MISSSNRWSRRALALLVLVPVLLATETAAQRKLKVATMSGIEPSVDTIASGEYPVSRPLFFYVKKDHIGVIPGLKEYVEFFTSDKMIGPDGPLADYGLVPLPEEELRALQQEIKDGKVLSM